MDHSGENELMGLLTRLEEEEKEPYKKKLKLQPPVPNLDLKILQNRIEELNGMVKKKDEVCKKGAKELEKLVYQRDQLNQRLIKQLSSNTTLSNENQDFKKRIRQLEKEKKELETRTKELEQEKDKEKQRNDAAERKTEYLKKKVKELIHSFEKAVHENPVDTEENSSVEKDDDAKTVPEEGENKKPDDTEGNSSDEEDDDAKTVPEESENETATSTRSNLNLKEITQEDEQELCDFCHQTYVDVVNYGPLYKLEKITVHYYCLLFSSTLMPEGEDHEGIMGFKLDDIWKEISRAKYIDCFFCGDNKATIRCSSTKRKCKDSYYHFPCGLEHGATFIFHDQFLSYCPEHKSQTPKIHLSKSNCLCIICHENVTESNDAISPPCCSCKAVFHKACVKKQALSEGSYHFKCPACANTEVYKYFMEENGVYVPIRDASWELEPSAYEGLNKKYSRCDQQPKCLCPFGREYNSRDMMKLKKNDERRKWWIIVQCSSCAAGAVHMKCANLDKFSYNCQDCAPIIQQQ